MQCAMVCCELMQKHLEQSKMPKLNKLFQIEVTDIFAGEANYSWATRHIIRANTMRGAINRFSKMSDMNWRCIWGNCFAMRYDSKSGATCLFIEEFNHESKFKDYRLSTDER